MKIYLGADHRGYALKEKLREALINKGYDVIDCGAESYVTEDDFVDYAVLVAQKVADDKESRGILLCGSGVGMCIAANKVKGIRCMVGHSEVEVGAGRNDDNCNILSLSSDTISFDQALSLIDIFLTTPFATVDRFERRINKIAQLEAHE